MEKKSCNVTVAVLAIATMALAAMGCWFCWHCPSRIYPPGAHDLFWRQLAWNGVGLAVFAAAWLTGWKRLLKAAPWLMAAWVVAISAAQFSRPVNGAHKWLPVGTVHVNVVTCFMPVFALFLAWLHDKKRIRPWMEWTAVVVAAIWAIWHVVGNGGRMERLAAFLRLGNWMPDRVYMSRQLLAAFDVSKWFGDADRSLGFLPCPESDGMMSASALMFGKWFPAVIAGLFAAVGTSLIVLWEGATEASKRRFTLLFGLWLIVPAAYCLLHSLAFLPVAGMSPALACYGGTAVVMAWFGVGVLAAMSPGGVSEHRSDIRTARCHLTACAWGLVAGVAVLLIAFAPKREFCVPGGDLRFAEPRPSDMEFGEFGLMAKRGRILAADGSPLAYTVRKWRFYLDPCVPDVVRVLDKESLSEIADGLGVSVRRLLEGYVRTEGRIPYQMVCDIAKGLGMPLEELRAQKARTDTIFESRKRYIFLSEVEDGTPAVEYFDRRGHWLTKCAGIVCEPVQERVYPLGSEATSVVGFMIRSAHTDKTVGAEGIEYACDKTLAGEMGVYDKYLPIKERTKRATPKPGTDILTTLLPETQSAVAKALFPVCATIGVESASALVVNVKSGEIEAMVSFPTFNPSMRRTRDKWAPEMAVNRPAQVLFEPGGLFTPLTYAIALDSGVLTEDAKIDQENGAWECNGVTIRDDATNALSIAEAIASRANIAAGKAACMIGPEWFHGALLRFGFGSKTGAAGISGEETGIVAHKPEHWDKTTLMFAGMGYGFAVTGLQIAQAYATLANHGMLVRPALVKAAATNDIVQVVSPQAADRIMKMLKAPMFSSVQKCERDPKTNRTVYSQTNYIASCSGFVPADKPEHVVIVSFSKSQSAHIGEAIARPVFEAISDALRPAE